jgi:hypothetical protein
LFLMHTTLYQLNNFERLVVATAILCFFLINGRQIMDAYYCTLYQLNNFERLVVVATAIFAGQIINLLNTIKPRKPTNRKTLHVSVEEKWFVFAP